MIYETICVRYKAQVLHLKRKDKNDQIDLLNFMSKSL